MYAGVVHFDTTHPSGSILSISSAQVEFTTAVSDFPEVTDESRSHLEVAATALGIDPFILEKGMCSRTIKGVGSVMVKNNTLEETNDTRAALTKKVYGLLFEHLVQKMNTSIGFQPGIDLVCGILDIFGFESFTVNSFEQLCINYANEELQLYFNNYLFKEEEKLYKAENIDIGHLNYPDNQECVELISRKPTGLLSQLDEECIIPKGSDEGFLNKIKKVHTLVR